jgi:hypothetical protein
MTISVAVVPAETFPTLTTYTGKKVPVGTPLNTTHPVGLAEVASGLSAGITATSPPTPTYNNPLGYINILAIVTAEALAGCKFKLIPLAPDITTGPSICTTRSNCPILIFLKIKGELSF